MPLAQVVGTKTAGRTAAFSFNFMPLLGAETEFAAKWINLCMAHVEEGIRDPIRCYEYLGRFYVQEGNKRVSVLKHFGAANVTASVIRVVPQYADNPDIRRYFDFMAFYALSGIYEVQLAQEGGYAKLQAAMGKKAQEEWTDDDRANIRSLLTRVGEAYRDHGGSRMRLSAGDVLVVLLQLYDYQTLLDDTPPAWPPSWTPPGTTCWRWSAPTPSRSAPAPPPRRKNRFCSVSCRSSARPGPPPSRWPLSMSAAPPPAPGPTPTSLAAPRWTRYLPARSPPPSTTAPSRAKTTCS